MYFLSCIRYQGRSKLQLLLKKVQPIFASPRLFLVASLKESNICILHLYNRWRNVTLVAVIWRRRKNATPTLQHCSGTQKSKNILAKLMAVSILLGFPTPCCKNLLPQNLFLLYYILVLPGIVLACQCSSPVVFVRA